jgi:hypothetical protein
MFELYETEALAESKISCICLDHFNLYIGEDNGSISIYEVVEREGKRQFQLKRTRRNVSKRSIGKVQAINDLGIILCLSGRCNSHQLN